MSIFFNPTWSSSVCRAGRSSEAAGQTAVVEPVSNQTPAFVGLTLDISFASLPLGVEGVEGEIEIMFGGFARVDRAALSFLRVRLHDARSLRTFARRLDEEGVGMARASSGVRSASLRRPKKRGPFQLALVIFLAITDRLA